MSKELYAAVMQNPAIDRFLRAMGIDPAQCGDFEIYLPIKGVITGRFNVFINTEQFSVLEEIAPELRKDALFRVLAIEITPREMEIK